MAKNYVSDAVVINSSTYDSVQFFDDKTRLAFYDAYILSGLMDETMYSGVSAADAFITLLRPTQVATAKRHTSAVENGRKGGKNNPHDEKFTIEEILVLKERGYTNRQIADTLDVKTRIPYKEVEVAVSYISHSDYLQNDLKLKEVSHIGFTHDNTLSIGMEVDNYEIVFILPTGREFVLYLKEIR